MEKGLNFTDYKTGHRQVQRFVYGPLRFQKFVKQETVAANRPIPAKL